MDRRDVHPPAGHTTAGRARLRTLIATGLVLLAGVGGCAGVDVTPSPTSTGGQQPDAAGARRDLAELTVAEPASMSGYSRDRFPHWRSTGKNCDVRDSVLSRDGEQVETEGCNVVGGSWYSAYDDKTYTDPKRLDIDHIVPLANAWRSGAGTWDDQRRGDFANDLDRPQLIAVSLSTNRAKGDQDPAQWKPPNRGYWCRYAEDWITVKHYWRLSVTSSEKSALDDMLQTCR